MDGSRMYAGKTYSEDRKKDCRKSGKEELSIAFSTAERRGKKGPRVKA